MTDNSSRTPTEGLDNAWAALASEGYILTSDQTIGLPKNFRQAFLRTYFNDRVLHCDEGDWPADRQRARDLIRYQWRDGALHLREGETTTILTDRAGIPGKRDHRRVSVLDDPFGEQLVRTFLSLVPPDRRQNDGTFGVNLFRTFTNVVSKPHRDNEEFVILYVLDRAGYGAESYLYHADSDSAEAEPTAEPVLRHQLNPGEILIFDDERFVHDASPLQPSLEGTAHRDVLVCTVDYRSTFLGEVPSACGYLLADSELG